MSGVSAGEVMAEKTAEDTADILGDFRCTAVVGRLGVVGGDGPGDRRGWGVIWQRQELVGVTVEGQQVEVDELLAGLMKLGGAQADGFLDTSVAPEAEATAVGSEGEVEVEGLGSGAH